MAATGLLDRGDPVPTAESFGALKPGTTKVLEPRAADPDGGPPWAIGVYDVKPKPLTATPVSSGSNARCVRVGRTQGGVLGVVGRDNLFANDERFHVLPPFASFTGSCGGLYRDGQLLMTKGGAPTPASGYSGAVTTPIGGCRMYGPPKKATSTAKVRESLKGIPRCDEDGRRIVKYGFAGRQATEVRFANDKLQLKMRPSPDGAYLFRGPPSRRRPTAHAHHRDLPRRDGLRQPGPHAREGGTVLPSARFLIGPAPIRSSREEAVRAAGPPAAALDDSSDCLSGAPFQNLRVTGPLSWHEMPRTCHLRRRLTRFPVGTLHRGPSRGSEHKSAESSG